MKHIVFIALLMTLFSGLAQSQEKSKTDRDYSKSNYEKVKNFQHSDAEIEDDSEEENSEDKDDVENPKITCKITTGVCAIDELDHVKCFDYKDNLLGTYKQEAVDIIAIKGTPLFTAGLKSGDVVLVDTQKNTVETLIESEKLSSGITAINTWASFIFVLTQDNNLYSYNPLNQELKTLIQFKNDIVDLATAKSAKTGDTLIYGISSNGKIEEYNVKTKNLSDHVTNADSGMALEASIYSQIDTAVLFAGQTDQIHYQELVLSAETGSKTFTDLVDIKREPNKPTRIIFGSKTELHSARVDQTSGKITSSHFANITPTVISEIKKIAPGKYCSFAIDTPDTTESPDPIDEIIVTGTTEPTPADACAIYNYNPDYKVIFNEEKGHCECEGMAHSYIDPATLELHCEDTAEETSQIETNEIAPAQDEIITEVEPGIVSGKFSGGGCALLTKRHAASSYSGFWLGWAALVMLLILRRRKDA